MIVIMRLSWATTSYKKHKKTEIITDDQVVTSK